MGFSEAAVDRDDEEKHPSRAQQLMKQPGVYPVPFGSCTGPRGCGEARPEVWGRRAPPPALGPCQNTRQGRRFYALAQEAGRADSLQF